MRKRNIFFITLYFIVSFANVYGQDEDYGKRWEIYTKRIAFFAEDSIDGFKYIDLSPAIKNIEPFPGYMRTTYIGVLGKTFQPIEFYINVKKDTNSSFLYKAKGKRKIGSDIISVSGKMILEKVYKNSQNEFDVYLGIFKYEFIEKNQNDKKGKYYGSASIMFYKRNDKLKWFWSESGDHFEYNNKFVGNYKFKEINIKCIFSYEIEGLYQRLPFCEGFYDKEEEIKGVIRYKIKEKYRQKAWENYKAEGVEKWWKK